MLGIVLNSFMYKFHSICISEEYSRFQSLGLAIFYFRKAGLQAERQLRLQEESECRILTAFLITTASPTKQEKNSLSP